MAPSVRSVAKSSAFVSTDIGRCLTANEALSTGVMKQCVCRKQHYNVVPHVRLNARLCVTTVPSPPSIAIVSDIVLKESGKHLIAKRLLSILALKHDVFQRTNLNVVHPVQLSVRRWRRLTTVSQEASKVSTVSHTLFAMGKENGLKPAVTMD